MSSPSSSPSSSASYRLSATAPCFPQPKTLLTPADGLAALQASPEISASIEDEQAVANLIASPPHRAVPLPSSLMASKRAAQGLERLDIPALPSIWSAAGAPPHSSSFESPVTPASSPLFTPASTRHPSANWSVNASLAPGTRVLGDFSRSSPCLPLLGHDPSSSPRHTADHNANTARASFDYIPPQVQQHHHHASTSPLLGHAFRSPPSAPAQRVQSSAYTPPPPSRSKSFFNTLSRAASWRPIQPLLPPVIGPNQTHALLPPNIVGSPPSSLNATHFALDPGISTGLHQPNPQTRDLPASKITRPRRETLYKTELCRSWEERGHCEYGEKCQFAHGPNELRTVSRHPKWKTELCRTYWREGACPYAKRCCFIHELHERQGSRPSSFDTHRPPLLARVRAGSSQEDVAAFACSPSSTSSSPTTTHLQQERANPFLTGRFGSSSFDLGRTRMANNNSTTYDLSKSSVSFSFSTSLGGGAATGSSSSLASARNSDLFGGIGLGISIPTTTPATTRPALPRSRTDPALNATLRASTSST